MQELLQEEHLTKPRGTPTGQSSSGLIRRWAEPLNNDGADLDQNPILTCMPEGL